MMKNLKREKANGVNGFSTIGRETSLGRKHYEQQVVSDRHQATARKKNLKIATWNVRSLFVAGRLEEVKEEMNRLGIDILGVCETHWIGNGKFNSDNMMILYSGGEQHARGVGFIMSKQLSKSLIGCWTISDRVMIIKLKGKPFDIYIIQVYAPTSLSSDEEIETFYSQLNLAMSICKNHNIKIVMGDLNAKVGVGAEGQSIGPHGLGLRNERGDLWAEWCEEKELSVMNTWFKHRKTNLYTWKSPDDQVRNQIDYFCVNYRFKNAITQCKTFPSADCNSDHNLLFANVVCKLKKLKKVDRTAVPEYQLLHTNLDVKKEYQIEVQNRFTELENVPNGMTTAEEDWCNLETILIESAEKILPKKEFKPKQKWMTTEILQLMNSRRRLKNKNNIKYNNIEKQIRQKCKEAKENWVNQQCNEIQDLEKKDIQMMYSKIKYMTKKTCAAANSALRNKKGEIVFDNHDILARWVDYIGELFQDDRQELPSDVDKELTGPPILLSEIQEALRKMKYGKAVGNDKINKEMLTAIDNLGINKLHTIVNKIYETGTIPQQMKESIFITLPKKGDLLNCNNYRLISLMSHVTKIIIRVIMARVRNKINPEIGAEQFGFRKGKGTRNATFVMRMLTERAIEMQKDVYVAFIDYEKAFDRVNHEEIIKDLETLNVDGKDLRILKNLYWQQIAAISLDGKLSNWVPIKRGVRQGCVLSPDLFSLYAEIIIRKLTSEICFKINGTNINNIRYADDTSLIANNEQELQELLCSLKTHSEQRGLFINKKKTKIMTFSKSLTPPKCNINLDNEKIEQVNYFEYLGSLLTSNCRCDKDITRRIAIAKKAFLDKKQIVTNKTVSIVTKKKLIKAYVWSVLLYGCESWTISKTMANRLEAMEMWCYRRMMKISWMERKTNEEVLQLVKEKRSMMKNIRQRQLKFVGHIVRENGLEALCLTGKIEGTRARGRQRYTYLDGLTSLATGNTNLGEFLHLTQNRRFFRRMVANVRV